MPKSIFETQQLNW